MKLNKEQSQKVFLSGLLLVGFLYFYFNTLIGGLASSERSATKKISDLEPKISAAEKDVREASRLEAGAPAALDRIGSVKGKIPEGSPLAWYPPKLSDFFKRHNITISTPRVQRDQIDFGVPGLTRMIWVVEMPDVDAIGLGIAVAGLENEDPLTRISSIQITSGEKDAERQHASVVLETIVKK